MIIRRPEWGEYKDRLRLLFETAFERELHPRYLDWRYYENNCDSLLFSVEKSADVLAASYSAFPVILQRDNHLMKSAVSMTTMTHPDWRGQGLFPKLAAQLYEFAKSDGIDIIWGFPNANSHPVFESKLKWFDIYEIPTLQLSYDPTVIAAAKISERVERDDDFAKIYPPMPNDGLIRTKRDKNYLSWRYAKNPLHKYQTYALSENAVVTSYIVTKRYEQGIDLVDIQCVNGEEAGILLAHIIRSSADEGAAHASCWAPTHHWIHGILERLGFTNKTPVTYFGGRVLNASAIKFDIFNYKNWYIQMGDSDVY
jgi:hypothetical protein